MNRSFLALVLIAALSTSCATSKIPKERHVTINTKASFKRNSFGDDDAYYTLDIAPDGEDRSVYWPENAPNPDSLAKNRSYTVELLEEEYRLPIGDSGTSYWSPELFRFSDGGRLLYDASVCRVHGIKMERVVVPISYGFPVFDREFAKAREADFPNTGMVLGGCCVNSERPSTRAWVCPTCVAREKRREEQSRTKNNG